MTPPAARSDRVADAIDDEMYEEWEDGSLRVAAAVAGLALEGHVPASQLPQIHRVIGTETAYLVSELMRRYEARDEANGGGGGEP